MSASHILVLNSIIYSLILALLIGVYRYIYPKKSISFIVLLLLISILPILSIFRPGTYESGDLTSHISETIEFYKVLSQGSIFPIWAGDMNDHYGYPAFLFFYQLPFYLTSLAHFIGFSYTNSVKIILALSYIGSGAFMYLFLKQIVNKLAAFCGSIIYLFSPYHLVDLHFRVDIGEIVAFAILPLILYLSCKVIEEKRSIWIFLETTAITCLILAHPAISLAGFPILLCYIFLIIKKFKKGKSAMFTQVIIFVIAVVLTAFYTIPLVLEAKYTEQARQDQLLSFLTPYQIIQLPWRYGFLYQGPRGQLSFFIGFSQIFIILTAFYLLVEKKIVKKDIVLLSFSIIVILACIFMLTVYSKPLWYIIPLIKNFQFTYRLLGIFIFVLSILSAIVVNNVKSKKLIYVICFAAIFSTILNWGNRRNIPSITDAVIEQQMPFIAAQNGVNQAITFWSDSKSPYAEKSPEHPVFILKGRGSIKQNFRNLTIHKYIVIAKSTLFLRENTLYFPGWNVYIDGKRTNIQILLTSQPRGLIAFTVPEGKHLVTVVFADTLYVLIGRYITCTVLLLFIFLLFLRNRVKLEIF